MKNKMNKNNEKEIIKKFIIEKIREHKEQTGYKGYNPVWKKMNKTIRDLGYEPREIYQEMEKEGLIRIRPIKGAVLLYLAEDLHDQEAESLKKELLAFLLKSKNNNNK